MLRLALSRAVVISIYDIQRAVADKATVPIYYESRISKLSLNAAELREARSGANLPFPG